MDAPERQQVYEFAGFRLIPREGLLLKEGEPVSLSPKVFETLVLLVERRGRLVTKAELMDHVWADAFVEENSLSKSVWAIRNALGEDAKSQQFIQTVPKRGYRFVAKVTEHQLDLANTPASQTKLEQIPQNVRSHDLSKTSTHGSANKRNFRIVLSLVVLAVLIGTAAVKSWIAVTNENASIRSLSVLPLENVSGDPEEVYFVDGMTNALIGDLARIRQLRVIAQSVGLKDNERDLSEVGRQMNVDGLLTGKIARFGEKVRISVQLIRASTGQSLWAKTYERNVSDAFVLQKEVAQNIANEIRITLSQQEQSQLLASRPVDPQALLHLFRGRYFLNRQNRGDQDKAIEELEQAVAIDPGFAIAYAQLAQAYVWKGFSFTPYEPDLAEKAYIATEKSLSIDPELADGYLARGRWLWTVANNFPHENAIKQYQRALELNPNLDEARNQLALVLCHIGALDEALAQSYEGVRINPTNNLLQLRIGQTLNSFGRYEEALKVLRAIPKEVHPSVVGHQTAWAYYNLGMKKEAAEKVDELLREGPDAGGTFASMQAVLAASSGEKEKAKQFIAQALEKGKGYGHFHHTAYTISCAYALMNEPDEAIKWLKVAADTGFPCYPSFLNDKNLDNLRQDPRFISFLEIQKQQWENRLNAL